MARNQIGVYWRQRAKQYWMEDGDLNTKFYHRVANSRRKLNAIENIVVEGELHADDSSVKGAIAHSMESFIIRIFHLGHS